MKVWELINLLQKEDPEAVVVTPASPCSSRANWEELQFLERSSWTTEVKRVDVVVLL